MAGECRLHVSREPQDGRIVYASKVGTVRHGATIPADSVPAAVRAALERDLARAILVGAERVTRGAVILYEVQARKNGRTRYLTYDPEGVRRE